MCCNNVAINLYNVDGFGNGRKKTSQIEDELMGESYHRNSHSFSPVSATHCDGSGMIFLLDENTVGEHERYFQSFRLFTLAQLWMLTAAQWC